MTPDQPEVRLANSLSFKALTGKSLLDSALEQGLVLEHSCRTGRCGVCRARATPNHTEVVQPEQCLNAEELAAGYILTCCRTAIADVELDIEDLGQLADIPSKILPCRISNLTRLKDDVVEVTLRTPPGNHLQYLPGQYVDVTGPGNITRSYSIANTQREDGLLPLHIRRVENGALSAYWFDQARVNDLLRLNGPRGTFYLRNSSVPIIFLATGTGIAPILAMLQQLRQLQETQTNIRLYWGGRTPTDFYWTPAPDEHPGLQFIPVLSRPDSTWRGRAGYVQQALIEDGFDRELTEIYACGSIDMIESARNLLTESGLDKRRFHFDAFVSSDKQGYSQ